MNNLPGSVDDMTLSSSEKKVNWPPCGVFECSRALERQVTEQANRMGVTVSEVKVQDPGYRWGSFGSGGRVSFHWKAILLPPRIAQFVVIHELAHGLHPDHSSAFWIKVEQHLSDWRGRKSWLAENGIQVEGIRVDAWTACGRDGPRASYEVEWCGQSSRRMPASGSARRGSRRT